MITPNQRGYTKDDTMKTVMLLILAAGITHAAEYKQFFLNDSGRQLDNAEAIIEAANGKNVYKCNSVEFKVSKTGTSIGVKNVKKPKVEK